MGNVEGWWRRRWWGGGGWEGLDISVSQPSGYVTLIMSLAKELHCPWSGHRESNLSALLMCGNFIFLGSAPPNHVLLYLQKELVGWDGMG